MKCLRQCLLILSPLYILWVVGCSTPLDSLSTPQSFLLPHALENYRSAGRVLLVTPDQKIPGELAFSLSGNLELRLQILVPVIGTLVYEIRANAEHFMILDFKEKTYFLDDNVAQTRHQWFGVDISLLELSWVVWGRMSQEEFQQRQGQRLSSKNLKFTSENAVFFVTLGANGIMERMVKVVEGIEEYEVTVGKYQGIEGKIYPRVIQIVSPQNQSKLRLVMNDITPQIPVLPALTFLPSEGMTPYRDE